MHISLAAEKLFDIFGFPITNTLLTSWLVMGLLIYGAYRVGKNIELIPNGLQNLAEAVIDGLLSFMTTIAGSREKAERFFPIVATIFLFVIAANWAGILPGVGSIGFYEEAHSAPVEQPLGDEVVAHDPHDEPEGVAESGAHGSAVTEDAHAEDAHAEEDDGHAAATAEGHADEDGHGGEVFVPLFRTVNSDLNVTLALAIIAVTLSHYFGVATLGAAKHAGKFFNFSNPIMFFVGILEFVSEFAKIISFSFRLFGNIFAGEVLLVIMTFLVPVLAPLPFYGLEIFVGFVQALIFAVLTMMFLVVATEHH